MLIEFQSDWNDYPCKMWGGAKYLNGYGHLVVDQKHYSAHRWVWFNEHGEIPAGADVMHACDTPACYEIRHLGLGTHTDNMQDAKRKGRTRGSEGSNHPRSVLTEAQVEDIKSLLSLPDKPSHAEIGRQYGISAQAIYKIDQGITWKHVEVGCQF